MSVTIKNPEEITILATGGTISLAVKYIKRAAQTMLYGCTSDTSKENLKFSAKDIANYVGVGFYAPDKIDGVTKYTCVWVPKALFGPPSLSYKTKRTSSSTRRPRPANSSPTTPPTSCCSRPRPSTPRRRPLPGSRESWVRPDGDDQAENRRL